MQANLKKIQGPNSYLQAISLTAELKGMEVTTEAEINRFAYNDASSSVITEIDQEPVEESTKSTPEKGASTSEHDVFSYKRPEDAFSLFA